MKSRFRLFGHPLHPMLIVFPSALFPLLLLMDALHWFTGNEALWAAGFWIALVGLVSTLAAIVPGVVDMAHIPDETRAHRTALWHAVVGSLTLLAYAVATWVRFDAASDRLMVAAVLDVVGTGLVSIQGWLGGELVYKHHVGVNTPAEGADPVVLTETPGGASAPAPARRQRDVPP